MAGSTAVLGGLLLARAGWLEGDAVAALFVALLVLIAAARLMRGNVDVLMDRVPAEAEHVARAAIARLEPSVQLRRLRMRQAAGRHFADVVIGVSPDAGVGQAHAAADAVEAAVQSALPGSDVVVHVEPAESEAALRERVTPRRSPSPACARCTTCASWLSKAGSRSPLHLKLPGDLTLEAAHLVASQVEHAIADGRARGLSVQTHLEPLREPAAGRAPAESDIEADAERSRGSWSKRPDRCPGSSASCRPTTGSSSS